MSREDILADTIARLEVERFGQQCGRVARAVLEVDLQPHVSDAGMLSCGVGISRDTDWRIQEAPTGGRVRLLIGDTCQVDPLSLQHISDALKRFSDVEIVGSDPRGTQAVWQAVHDMQRQLAG
jgi:hypothetical protein